MGIIGRIKKTEGRALERDRQTDIERREREAERALESSREL